MPKFFILMESNLYFFLENKNILCFWTIFNNMGKAAAKIVHIGSNSVK